MSRISRSVEEGGGVAVEALEDVLDEQLPDCLRTIRYFVALTIVGKGTHLAVIEHYGYSVFPQSLLRNVMFALTHVQGSN